MKLNKLTLVLTALCTTSFACAHNVWIEPSKESGQYVVKFGHEETETYPESKLKAVQLMDAEGKMKQADYYFNQGEAYFSGDDSSLVFIRFDNGVWSKLPNGKYVEKTKRQEPSAEFSINPLKAGKAVLKWDNQALKAHGMEYELIPQTKPQVGKPLHILVLHNGQPLKGIKVGLGEDHPFNLTNEKGIAEFTPVKGYNKVWAEFEEEITDSPDYDRRSVEYMLTFNTE